MSPEEEVGEILFPSKNPLLWQGPNLPPHFFKWFQTPDAEQKTFQLFFKIFIRWCPSPFPGQNIKLEDSRACLEGILDGEEVQTQKTNIKCSQMFFWNGRVKNPSLKGQRKGEKREKSWFWKMRSCLSEEMWMCVARMGQVSLLFLCFLWGGLTFEIYIRKVTCLFPVLGKME